MLNLVSKKITYRNHTKVFFDFLIIMLGLFLLSECDKDQILFLIFLANLNLSCAAYFVLKLSKNISGIIFFLLHICFYSIAATPMTSTLCIVVFQIKCLSFTKNIPLWLPIFLIILSNDIDVNPRPPFHNSFFNFMNWNLNSLAKDNFQRVQLIKAHNSIFDYDLITICETSLSDVIELPETQLDEYRFVPANNPANTRHGGVGLFYKTSLPFIVRNDLSFDESIVVELKFGPRKIFFTVLYRSPSSNHTSPEFQTFLTNFENLYSKIKAEKPFATFFAGDFNAHSSLWWSDGDTNPEGTELDDLFTLLGLSQLISEPTNFEPYKNPSCIDLLITAQPNLILDSGTRPSLDPYCHHQIIYDKINVRVPPPPPFERKIWHFNRANSAAIKLSMVSFPWLQHLSLNTYPNCQAKSFTDIFLSIMEAFIPNDIKKITPRDPPWITKHIKALLNKKKFYKNFKRHGYKTDDKDRFDAFRTECH